MFRGRILVVSDRSEVIAELDPIIRAEGHLTLTVPNGDEALRVFDEGIIPDVIVSDLGSSAPGDGIYYLNRFRQLNQLGQHLVVLESGAAFDGELRGMGVRIPVESYDTLPRPFDEARVRNALQDAMDRIRRDLESLRAEMFREAARMQKAIRDAQMEMVTALALTMEAKDPYMRGHCERVAELCRRLATAMELDDAPIELLSTAALLHEIGKIGVSLDLLHRSGPLTPEEMNQVRAHPQVGGQIVSAVPSLKRAAILIENQYTDFADLPPRIARETPEFRLAGILRVIDTYDALTSERAFREVLPRERWERILREGVGTRFDPAVVEAFFALEAADPEFTK